MKEKFDEVFAVNKGEDLDYDTVNMKFYNIIKQLSAEGAYDLIDEAINYLLPLRDSEKISYMLEFISSLYGIAGTNELTDLHEVKVSVIDRQVELYGNQFAKNVLENLKRELDIAK
ncbi:hypothetical protein ACMGE6_04120 [Macrococcus equi]|uniref:hypothetical protein n=1 Tax=Macrococcus equi TaxID=3395462 RepID=UPI0039BEA07F